MCIYYGNEPYLTYQKKEHVFPAGLGGISMLPQGYVSDQANELFSPLEAELMHNSLIGVPRMLFGPGKRGSHNPKKASRSKIATMHDSDGKITLGYISDKQGYYICCLARRQNELIFTVASEQHKEPEKSWYDFKKGIENFGDKFVYVSNSCLEPNDWAFGIYEDKYYVALGKECTIELIRKALLEVVKKSQADIDKIKRKVNHPSINISIVESDSVTKMYAKVAINVLAFLKGYEYINQDRFTHIKKWILGGREADDFKQLPRVTNENALHLPEQCHWCIFLIHEGKLCATVCFYNRFSRNFELADAVPHLDNEGNNSVLGLICDWQHNNEYTFSKWITKIAESL